MFNTHRIGSRNISARNLVLLFFTIVFGFASVITLANVDIISDIENARQTIGRITITSDGTNDGIRYFDFNYSGDGKTFINTSALLSQSSFSGKVLGIDDEGNLIYVASTNLVVSGAGGGIGGDGYRTGYGSDIWNVNLGGKVGIGTDTPTGKLHITSSGETDVYIEEQAAGMAASLRLLTPLGTTWIIGGDSDPNIFFIGTLGHQEYFAMTTGGFVGIGTIDPKAPLQVKGNIIGGVQTNTITGSNSTIAGGGRINMPNTISGTNSFIGGGYGSKIIGDRSAIVVGGKENNTIIGNDSFIGGGDDNTISGTNYANIVGGKLNQIYGGTNTFIGGGVSNVILGNSSNSFIGGGTNNHITNATDSFAGGMQAYALHNNTFVWNGGTSQFASARTGTFIINVPFSTRPDMGGVGINTNDPQALLDVNGTSIIRGNLTVTGNILGDQDITVDGEVVAKNIEVDQRSSTVSAGTSCGSENPGTIIYDGVGFYGCTANNTRKRLDN